MDGCSSSLRNYQEACKYENDIFNSDGKESNNDMPNNPIQTIPSN